ncbi:unnamed protein product [Didymodactylos carnosus]|uniref:C2H2-type domain-containing protein n=1 Tax=Didymodactylos carnosus TaxID=1234261 RepID=A0A815P6N7_9BILA|nr:unnamed protein product [Didymodactylos carnosus]CAF4319837.1 unnamed protein product [Didymodactylos carnosus]
MPTEASEEFTHTKPDWASWPTVLLSSFPKLISSTISHSNGIRVHRSWKVGDGKLIVYSKLQQPKSVSTIVCSDTPKGKTIPFTKSEPKSKQYHLSKPHTGTHEAAHVSRLFECYEEGCVKTFLRQGNLVNHLVAGKHQRLPERLSLRDTGMQIYASKLERIGQRELVSVVLRNTTDAVHLDSQSLKLPEGWALPKARKVVRLTPKQIEYLTNKFNDGIKNNTRWKPEAVAAEMEYLKDKGIFIFADNELLKASQIRSYFSRLKSNRQIKLRVEQCDNEDVEAFKEEQAIDEAVQRQQLRHKVHTMDQFELSISPKRSSSSSEIPAKRHSLRKKKT